VVTFEFLACNKQYSTCVSWLLVYLLSLGKALWVSFAGSLLQGIGGSAVFTCHAHAISLCLQQRVNLPRDMEEFILVNLPSRRVKAMMLHLRGSLVNIGFLTWGRSLAK